MIAAGGYWNNVFIVQSAIEILNVSQYMLDQEYFLKRYIANICHTA